MWRRELLGVWLLRLSWVSLANAADDSVKVRFTWKIKGQYAPLYMCRPRACLPGPVCA
jgi:hypothetical protein